METSRKCIQCNKEFPLTSEHWHKTRDGFHSRCKECRNIYEQKAKRERENTRLADLEKNAVELFVSQARVGGANIPHSSEMLEVLMSYFGGVAGFANVYMKQYFDAPPGGAFRTKMLDTIVRLTSSNTAMGGAKKPLTLWSDEELDEELTKRLTEAATILNLVSEEPKRVEHTQKEEDPEQ